MKARFLFLLRLALVLLALFVLQKPLFLAVNCSYGSPLVMADWLSVVWHGLRLDLVAACYIMVVPLVVLLVGLFVPRLNYRAVLTCWYVPVALLVTLAFVADAMLYYYWGAKLDASDFFYAQNPKDLFASLSVWLVIAAFLFIFALVAAIVWLLRRITPQQMEPIRLKPLWALVLLLAMGLDFVGIRGGVGASTANPGYACFSQKSFLNHAALNPLFNIVHSMAKNEDLASQFQYYGRDELQTLTAGLYESNPAIADTLLRCRRPDVVLVVWEGGGDLMLSDSSVAPNFAQLKSQGAFFSNCYANSFRTDRGLVSILSGWPALPTTSIMKMSACCRHLPSLARSLSRAGYHSAFYYGGDIDFTNMRGYLYDTGYERVEGDRDFPEAPADGKWGIQDEYLLRCGARQWPSSPSFATYLTLSSHEPWEVPYHRLSEARANAFAYTDSCLGAFVAGLRQLPSWDSLLVIIVPDHGVARSGESLSDPSVARIPMLWLGGAVARPCQVDVLMNQSDLAATLLAQLGLPCDDFPFSRNVLSPGYRPTVTVHAFKNGVNLIDSSGVSQFGCIDGQLSAAGTAHRADAETQARALLQLFYSATARLGK